MRPATIRSFRPLVTSSSQSLPTQITRRLLQRSLSRPFHASLTRPEQQEVVLVRPARSYRRRIALIATNALCAWFIWNAFFNKLDDAIGDVEEIELPHDEEEEESFFIPLTFPKQLPSEFYKNSDPEWQEFVKISNDPKRKKAIREELSERVLRDIQRHPKTQHILGSNIRLTKHWLEIKFPDAPPPEYVRTGIEIADEYIAYSQEVLPQSHYVSLAHILKPRAVWTAVKLSVKMFYLIQKTKVKAAFGLPLDQTEKQVAMVYKVVRDVSRQQAQIEALESVGQSQDKAIERLLGKNASNPSTPAGEARPPQQQKQPQSPEFGLPSVISARVWERLNSTFNPFASSAAQSSTSSSTSESEEKSSGFIRLPSLPISVAIMMQTFQATLAKAWFQTRTDPQPKGSFVVFGEVEVMGEKGRAKCDVKAAYDPKQAKYVWVICNVKNFWELKQRAKGGP